MQQSGQLYFLEDIASAALPFSSVHFAFGHTEKQMLPAIEYKGHKIVFCADLLPSVGHIPLPYVMAYDMRPLITLEEKRMFWEKAAAENWVLFLEHDPINQCATLQITEKGIRLKETFPLSALG
jgi:hypothetical protein